jgi:hypothetical protein
LALARVVSVATGLFAEAAGLRIERPVASPPRVERRLARGVSVVLVDIVFSSVRGKWFDSRGC